MLRIFLSFLLLSMFGFTIAEAQVNLDLQKTVDSLVQKDQEIRFALNSLESEYHKSEKKHGLRSFRYKSLQKQTIIDDSLSEEYQHKYDSISAKMLEIDQSNREVFEELILTYGYPGKKLVGHYNADKLLLHTNFKWIKRMFPVLKKEVEKGNLRPITLANAYDKFSKIAGEGFLYHTLLIIDESNKITQTVPTDLERTNAARKELGLKPIKLKKNGKRKG